MDALWLLLFGVVCGTIGGLTIAVLGSSASREADRVHLLQLEALEAECRLLELELSMARRGRKAPRVRFSHSFDKEVPKDLIRHN